jgi:hypothetical protein
MRPCLRGVVIVVVAAAVLAAPGFAVAQQASGGGDTFFGDDVLTTVSHALPAFIAWVLAFILVLRLLGILEMSFPSVLLVLATIGAILWRYHWLPVH